MKHVAALYEKQTELNEDLTTDGEFSSDDLVLLFTIVKKLELPIIVGTDSRGISRFLIYKGESIQNLTEIQLNGSSIPDHQKTKDTFYIKSFYFFRGSRISGQQINKSAISC